MEVFLLGCLVLLLAILTVVIVILTQSVTRISKLEEAAIKQAESATTPPEALLPQHLQAEFEQISQKQQAYFDTLLHSTITSFDKQLHGKLQTQADKQLQDFDKKFATLTKKLNTELDKMVEKTINDSSAQTEMLSGETKKLNTLMQQRLREHYTDIAWQYITQSLAKSVDLHAQKSQIIESLSAQQAAIKKDYNDD